MKTDSYQGKAIFYDTFVGPITKILRKRLLQLASPGANGQVLEVGCGTGLNLELFQEAKCDVHGIDLSREMIKAAGKKLGDQVGLHTGDAADIPYPTSFFDRVIIMLALHEMSSTSRFPVLKEAARVLKPDGRLLVVDYHPRPIPSPKGRLLKTAIFIIERIAGKTHFSNYKNFIRNNGLLPLIETCKLSIEQQEMTVGGNIVFYRLKKISSP